MKVIAEKIQEINAMKSDRYAGSACRLGVLLPQ